ncbi:hypothetical protein LDFHOB_06510 [Candidatus Electronema aureum]
MMLENNENRKEGIWRRPDETSVPPPKVPQALFRRRHFCSGSRVFPAVICFFLFFELFLLFFFLLLFLCQFLLAFFKGIVCSRQEMLLPFLLGKMIKKKDPAISTGSP